MSAFVNIHDAKTRLSQLVARVERGERVFRPSPEPGGLWPYSRPPARAVRSRLPPDDPLLHLDTFAVDGPGGSLTNDDIDRLLYGRS